MDLNVFIVVTALWFGWLFGLYSRGLLTAQQPGSCFGLPFGFISPARSGTNRSFLRRDFGWWEGVRGWLDDCALDRQKSSNHLSQTEKLRLDMLRIKGLVVFCCSELRLMAQDPDEIQIFHVAGDSGQQFVDWFKNESIARRNNSVPAIGRRNRKRVTSQFVGSGGQHGALRTD
jgi:hypothetical protein